MNAENKAVEKSNLEPIAEPNWLSVLRAQLDKTQFGTFQLTIHNSKVVRIEKTEKFLLDPTRD